MTWRQHPPHCGRSSRSISKFKLLLEIKIKKMVYNIVNRRNAGAGSCPSKFKIPFFETEPRGPDTLDEIHEVWVWSVWVCTGTAMVHTGMYWYKQRFPKQMRADVYLTLDYSRWYLECGTSIWWYSSMILVPPSPWQVHHDVGQLANTGMYQYIPVCTMITDIFLRIIGFFVSNDCGKRYFVCVTCMRWYSNTG